MEYLAKLATVYCSHDNYSAIAKLKAEMFQFSLQCNVGNYTNKNPDLLNRPLQINVLFFRLNKSQLTEWVIR